ncbi:MAG: exodeoxyribonuclease VII small subunit [bacterium]|nr:exodeoxyribonuclease VII small subunit [bacterium]
MKDQSFAKAFEELEKITQSFEKGAFDLDDGLKQFERGLELAAVLKKKLSDIENKVEVIKKKFGKSGEAGPGSAGEDDATAPF